MYSGTAVHTTEVGVRNPPGASAGSKFAPAPSPLHALKARRGSNLGSGAYICITHNHVYVLYIYTYMYKTNPWQRIATQQGSSLVV